MAELISLLPLENLLLSEFSPRLSVVRLVSASLEAVLTTYALTMMVIIVGFVVIVLVASTSLILILIGMVSSLVEILLFVDSHFLYFSVSLVFRNSRWYGLLLAEDERLEFIQNFNSGFGRGILHLFNKFLDFGEILTSILLLKFFNKRVCRRRGQNTHWSGNWFLGSRNKCSTLKIKRS